MPRTALTLVPLMILALLVFGCSDNPADTAATNSADLNDFFGGYTATPEPPGFGDPSLLAGAGSEVSYDDPILASPAADSIVGDPEAGFFSLRVVWGRLRYDSTVTTPTDWTGSLAVTRGVEIVRRVIAFEPAQDYVLERTDPKLVAWVSRTTVHHDGVAIDIFVPRPHAVVDTVEIPIVDTLGDTTWQTVIDTFPSEPVEVTFATGPYTRTFTLGELVALDTIVYLDDSNAVAFHAFRMDRVPCARGFLAGFWGVDEEGNNEFRGMWMSRFGYLEGWLQGTYGRNDAGENVFVGKWVDDRGNFEGFLRGTWMPHPDRHASDQARRHAGGWFAGRIYDADRNEIGLLRGKFASDFRPAKPGYFQGMWRLHCGRTYGQAWDDDDDNDGWSDHPGPGDDDNFDPWRNGEGDGH
ncbi:MAG TPA: hypothetical protein PLR32_00935 [candidate division Zixibacteria bacterium]|nr:hypothetical protein [candidate division Zixibacteria bacterium]MDD4917470.1 hypothetical protein [candidate division Zixibacteria bacterium]MDM7972315.1 hypothetical protein [candidate division Zixibacteria bacterium]HOZ08093.1 hypothetical protein [candidate division Zixibacteria bacterium]HPI31849.1 hypothetical protein [candidate division Zixibacteria bacterium]